MGVWAGIGLAARRASSVSLAADRAAPFELLVVGDSLVWGQGLVEEQKFYYLTKQWLEREVFQNTRRVNLKVKAHSGASIDLRSFESDALLAAEIGENEFFHPEINLSFPSIRAQADAARGERGEYENPETVDLIMLTGGVTDIRLSTILNPLKNNDELKSEISAHCDRKMFGLLEHLSSQFPNALVAVGGYYPFLSKYTPASTIFNSLLEINDVPEPLKTLINNRLNRRLLKRYRRKIIERSMIWAIHSTREFQKAVDRLNQKFDRPRAVFIESPIREEHSLGAKNTLLFEITKNGKATDALSSERKSVCRKTLDELRDSTKLKLRARTCELAAIGHPTAAGARAYAEAFREKLAPFII
jgi:hypothetical protein